MINRFTTTSALLLLALFTTNDGFAQTTLDVHTYDGATHSFQIATIDSITFSFEGKPDSSLIAYWPFNGDATDQSGNNHDGVLEGDPTLADDRFGNPESAYYFDGDGDFVNIGHNLRPSLPLTVSAWVNPNDLSNHGSIFRNDKFESTSVYHGIIFYYDADGVLGADIGSGIPSPNARRGRISDPAVITEGNWQHVVLVIHSIDDIRLYLDGIEVEAEETGSGTNMTYSQANFDGAIGELIGSNSTTTDGLIDDVCVYDRALSEYEIQSLFREGGWGAPN